jgi:hypothetical protein
MKLPKANKIKLINQKEFIKTAREVKKGFEEQFEYLYKKKAKNGDTISSHFDPSY